MTIINRNYGKTNLEKEDRDSRMYFYYDVVLGLQYYSL